jgi:asparagine synthase (glutamine-hydrolysing)
MCGIFGAALPRSSSLLTEEWVRRCTDRMFHRGPDDGGTYVAAPFALGHRRLSIIDLSGGHQPMPSADGSLMLAFNGEIYNYREERARLQARGHVFQTQSDSEVILAAYREYGVDCVKHLRGMFAFAIHDRRANTLYVARDRIGIKPLYIATPPGGFVFASELKALLATGLVDRRPNVAAVESFMSVGFTPGPDTMLASVRKLMPGSWALVDAQANVRIERYWNLGETLGAPVAAPREAFSQALEDVISSHMVSDVPIGAFLSGGLDSSTVVALMSKRSSQPVRTFTVGYKDDPQNSELGFARIVADAFKTEHHEFLLEPTGFNESIDLFLEYGEEPIGEPQAIALYHLSKLAAQHVKVLLSGEGMDEVLGGYPLYQSMPKIERLHKLARGTGLALLLPALARGTSNAKLAKYLDWIRQPLRERYRSVNTTMTPSLQRKAYGPALIEAAGALPSLEAVMDAIPDATLLQKLAVTDFAGWLPDCLLLRGDKMTMAASIEARVPFLDHGFVELAMNLPDSSKIGPMGRKSLLREIMTGVLPDIIINRPKQGFTVPVARWISTSLRDSVRETLLGRQFLDRGYAQRSYIEQQLGGDGAIREDNAYRLFRWLILERWHQRYVDAA